MKISKFFTMAAVSLLSPMLMTSCLNDDDDDHMKVTTTFSQFFNAINDPETGETNYFPGVSYTLETQLQAPIASLKIEGLRLPNGMSYPSMVFVDVPWKTNERGWTEISLSNATPEGVGGFIQTPSFSSLTFQAANRYFSSVFVPCVNVQYTVDGYRVFSFPEQILEVGKTEVTDKATGSVYKPNDNHVDPAVYLFQVSPTTRKATLTISGAKFHQNMPAMNMRFSDISFTVDAAGNIVMEKESLIPSLLTGNNLSTSVATPMPSAPVSNFKATYDPDRGIWVEYDCAINMEKFQGDFHISMTNEYPTKISDGSNQEK